MTMKLTRDAYEKLIQEDLEWLDRQDPCLERGHIREILLASAGHEYSLALAHERERAERYRVALRDTTHELGIVLNILSEKPPETYGQRFWREAARKAVDAGRTALANPPETRDFTPEERDGYRKMITERFRPANPPEREEKPSAIGEMRALLEGLGEHYASKPKPAPVEKAPSEEEGPECIFEEDAQEPGDCAHCGGGWTADIHQPRSPSTDATGGGGA